MQKTSSSLCSLLSRSSRFVRSSSFDDGGCVFRLWIGADPSIEDATTSASSPASSIPLKHDFWSTRHHNAFDFLARSVGGS